MKYTKAYTTTTQPFFSKSVKEHPDFILNPMQMYKLYSNTQQLKQILTLFNT